MCSLSSCWNTHTHTDTQTHRPAWTLNRTLQRLIRQASLGPLLQSSVLLTFLHHLLLLPFLVASLGAESVGNRQRRDWSAQEADARALTCLEAAQDSERRPEYWQPSAEPQRGRAGGPGETVDMKRSFHS